MRSSRAGGVPQRGRGGDGSLRWPGLLHRAPTLPTLKTWSKGSVSAARWGLGGDKSERGRTRRKWAAQASQDQFENGGARSHLPPSPNPVLPSPQAERRAARVHADPRREFRRRRGTRRAPTTFIPHVHLARRARTFVAAASWTGATASTAHRDFSMAFDRSPIRRFFSRARARAGGRSNAGARLRGRLAHLQDGAKRNSTARLATPATGELHI